MMLGLVTTLSIWYDDVAAPDGAPPRRIGDKKIQKTPCPPCLREALR
jgi:hypothetical protein